MRAPFSSVIGYAADFFDEHAHLDVKTLASNTTHVDTRYELIDDCTDTVRRHHSLDVSWAPRRPWFPHFQGHLTVRPQDSNSVLSIEWAYRPPGGFLGVLFDAAVGARLARGTMDHLLRRLRRYVEKRYQGFQASRPSVEELNEAAASAD